MWWAYGDLEGALILICRSLDGFWVISFVSCGVFYTG